MRQTLAFRLLTSGDSKNWHQNEPALQWVIRPIVHPSIMLFLSIGRDILPPYWRTGGQISWNLSD
jgi:hypothetical protein